MIINNIPISRNNSILVTFTCITCSIQREITLNLFMRKVHSENKSCLLCCDEAKCKSHSEFMTSNNNLIHTGEYISTNIHPKSLSLRNQMELSIHDWENEDDEYKSSYFLRNLTIDEFERIRSKIIGINNKKITDLSAWIYSPHFRIYNQIKYVPILINNTTSAIERPHYITFLCESCENEFTHRDLYNVKIKMYCKDCSLTNRTFRIRKHTLKNGKNIVWQSTPEKRFIDWCEDNAIPISNGPKIDYPFQDKTHIYRVDFEISDRKILIEIKDNHCWYRQQVKSGKQPAKEIAMKEYCEKNEYTYLIIFPKTLSHCKDIILQKPYKI